MVHPSTRQLVAPNSANSAADFTTDVARLLLLVLVMISADSRLVVAADQPLALGFDFTLRLPPVFGSLLL